MGWVIMPARCRKAVRAAARAYTRYTEGHERSRP
nr:MAG TPA: hypothetical protein [Caudoviricetes sp.]DAT35829.1 MAG TPA: hypothetical protein [Caudoviricetes sp.]